MSNYFYVSPEQLIKDRAEFAQKGIARGRSIVAAIYDNSDEGRTLIAERTPEASLVVYDATLDRGGGLVRRGGSVMMFREHL